MEERSGDAADPGRASDVPLANRASAQDEIDSLVERAWELRMSHPQHAWELAEDAHRRASSGTFVERPYVPGLAAALFTLGFVDTYAGRFVDAAARCRRGLDLLEAEPNAAAAVKGWLTLAWNSFFLSDHPSAMEYGLRVLKAVRFADDRLGEAWALDAVASFHGATGAFSQALPLHEDALQLFRELGDACGEMRALNNWAVSLHQLQQYDAARAAGEESVRIAQRHGFAMDEANNVCTLAEILLDLGHLNQAEQYLKQALAGAASTAQVYALHTLSRLCVLQGNVPEAQRHLSRALLLAEALGQRAEQAFCHRTLADHYERTGRYAEALAHFKQYHEIQQVMAGGTAASRLDVLKITYQVEAAQHRADLFHQQAQQLQDEVETQRKAQVVLERASYIDSLTNLYNRRYLDIMLAREHSRHAQSGAPLSIALLDVDHFKSYNDAYGHPAGDECLRQIAQVIRDATHRPEDTVARYGGEEFILVLPDTSGREAAAVAETLRERVAALRIPHHHSSAANHVTVSVGVATGRCTRVQTTFELVARADERLYAAKAGGRNQVQCTMSPEGTAL